MPNYQKKAQNAMLKDARDRGEEATDLSRVKNEFIQWKHQLSALEKEEHEEVDDMGTMEKIFKCSRPMCSLLPVCKRNRFVACGQF